MCIIQLRHATPPTKFLTGEARVEGDSPECQLKDDDFAVAVEDVQSITTKLDTQMCQRRSSYHVVRM